MSILGSADEVFNVDDSIQESKYTRLVLSGGAMKGLAQLGALEALMERGTYNYEYIDTFAGTSIGAVLCFLLVCGYTPKEIFTKALEIKDFFPSEQREDTDISKILERTGLLTNMEFGKQIMDLCTEKMGSDFIPTFENLYNKTGKRLVIVATNLTKHSPEYFSHVSHPRMSVISALRLSTNIPVVFQNIKYCNSYYTDGGISDNLPLEFVDDKKSNIIAISVHTSYNTDYTLNNIPHLLRNLLSIPISRNQRNVEKSCDRNRVLMIAIDVKSSSGIIMTDEQKQEMFSEGYAVVSTL